MPRTKVVITKSTQKRAFQPPTEATTLNTKNRDRSSSSKRASSTKDRSPSKSSVSKSTNRAQSSNRNPSTTKGASKSDARLGSHSERYNRRFRAPESALRNIREYNKKPTMLIRRAPFQRVVRDVSNTITKEDDALRYTITCFQTP